MCINSIILFIIAQLGSRVFKKCSNLVLIDLQKNLINKIVQNAFEGLAKLETLLLNNNQLTECHAFTFLHLSNINQLSLLGNKLATLHRDLFTG